MHNIKDIRNNFDNFKNIIKSRNVSIDLDEIIDLDKNNRNLIQKKESLEQEKKEISKKKDKSLFAKSKEISEKIITISKEQSLIKNKLDNLLSSIPNLPLNDVPVGSDESFNKEILKSGTINKFSFDPKSHYELGENLNMLDFDLATKTTGARFVFVKDKLALLERAIANFMLDTHTKINGYKEISPPLMANESTMFGTGQLPKFEDDQFEIQVEEKSGRKFLIPTAEVILTNMVKDQIVNIKDFPMRFVALTPCFRKEAGSYGKDTKGLHRLHQFNKVELMKFSKPENSYDELESLLLDAESILQKLGLHYRVISLCSGDLSFSAAKCYDIEVWSPFENKYLEVSSCSNFQSFQARRGNIKFRNTKTNKLNFVHTLNGSGLATPRLMVALLETYQKNDGTINFPNVIIII